MRGTGTLAVLGAAAAFAFAKGVFLTLATSFFVVVLLEPTVAWLFRRGAGRKLGASAAVGALVAVCAGAAWGFWQPVASIYDDLPVYVQKIRFAMSGVDARLRRIEVETKRLKPQGTEDQQVPKVRLVERNSDLRSYLLAQLGPVFHAAGLIVFVPFLAWFALVEKDVLMGACRSAAGDRIDFDRLSVDAAGMVRGYFLGNLAVGLSLAAVQGALFALLGLKNAAGLGLLTGLANIVPIVGLPIALALTAAQGLLQFHRPLPWFVLAAALSALHLFVGNAVIPRFIGSRINLHSTAAAVGLVVWGWLWGPAGFILAIPLTALIKILLESRPETAAAANLLGRTRPPRPARP